MMAHELGHGAFHLKHTFSEYSLSPGATENLMDYPARHRLDKWQWDKIHNPERVLGLFEGDEEGGLIKQGKFYVYQRSFAPWKMFGSFLVSNFDRSYAGDNRKFSLKNNAISHAETEGENSVTSRLYQKVEIDILTHKVVEIEKYASETVGPFVFLINEDDPRFGTVKDSWVQGSSISGDTENLSIRIQGSNPKTPLVAPDIDWKLNLELTYVFEQNKEYLVVRGEALGKGFPAYEAFIEDAGGIRYYLITLPAPDRDDLESDLLWPVNDIYGDLNDILLKFELDMNGRFTGSIFKGSVAPFDWLRPIDWFSSERISWTKLNNWNEMNEMKIPSSDCGEYEGECGGLNVKR